MLINQEKNEKLEAKKLVKYAVKSSESLGRKFDEQFDDDRLSFQRDKDRIVHCKAFRRLNQKTQVFVSGSGDHYRTRLTHTLEVAQISRGIARSLGLNEDLCEAIALAHELGHPPYGHGGEEALNCLMKKFGDHFEHNDQSRRIVEKLEKLYPDFDGLNLTFEVLDGLIKHQTAWDQVNMDFATWAHLEAQVVNSADEIAYTNHDMDDGLRSGLITIKDLEKFDLWLKGKESATKKYGKILNEDIFISRTISAIIALMICDFCNETEKNIEKFNIKTLKDVRKSKEPIAVFSKSMKAEIKNLRQFLYDSFYMNPKVHKFVMRGQRMIKELFMFFMENKNKLPKKYNNNDAFIISVKDYIAGMTDGFLVEEYSRFC